MRKYLAVLSIAVLVLASFSCISGGGLVDLGFGAQKPTTTHVQVVKELKIAVTAVHNGLYVPTMQLLGLALDAGKISPDKEAKIQAASENYQRIKTQIAAAISFIDATNVSAQSETVRQQMGQLLQTVGELQKIQGGGQ